MSPFISNYFVWDRTKILFILSEIDMKFLTSLKPKVKHKLPVSCDRIFFVTLILLYHIHFYSFSVLFRISNFWYKKNFACKNFRKNHEKNIFVEFHFWIFDLSNIDHNVITTLQLILDLRQKKSSCKYIDWLFLSQIEHKKKYIYYYHFLSISDKKNILEIFGKHFFCLTRDKNIYFLEYFYYFLSISDKINMLDIFEKHFFVWHGTKIIVFLALYL